MSHEMGEYAAVLSIGSMFGGRTPANRAWNEEISRLVGDVRAARTGVDGPLNVNVVFHVPGDLLRPDFSGVRTGSFDKARRLLMVQAALSEAPPAQPRTALLDFVDDAISEAEAWALKKRVEFDRAPLERVLQGVARY